MKQLIWVGVIVIVLAAAGGWWYANNATGTHPQGAEEQTIAGQTIPQNTKTTAGTQAQTVSSRTDKTEPQLSASPLTGTAPLGVSFSANKQGLIDNGNYSVDFGDGTQSSTLKFTCGLQFCTQQHVYQAAGTYTVKYSDEGGNIAKTFIVVVSAPSPVTYKTITNDALHISLQAPSNWKVEDRLSDAQQLWIEDPASLYDQVDGYGFSVSIGTTTYSNAAPYDFATIQGQSNGYEFDKTRLGCNDNDYKKVENRTVSGLPAVLFTTTGGCDSFINDKTLWIHAPSKDWFVIFDDFTYTDKHPYEVPIEEAILSSIQVTP